MNTEEATFLPYTDSYSFAFWDYADELDHIEFAAVEYFCAPYTSHSFMLIPLIGGQQ